MSYNMYTGAPGSAYQAAGNNRLTADWRVWESDPNLDWMSDAATVRARAWDLFRNDPVMAALHQAKLVGTHGSRGLNYRSLYAEDESNETSKSESDVRRKADDVIARYNRGFHVDASSTMSRVEFEKALDSLATVSGEGYAIRAWLPGRPRTEFATCWKLIRPERVCNPPGVKDSQGFYQGWELDDNGAPQALWIGPPRRLGQSYNPAEWSRVPWHAADGCANVIYRTGLRVPGMYRAISMFAPNLLLEKQIKGCIDAYVVAKRIQACHPMFIECENPVEAAKNDRNGAVYGPNTSLEPGKTYYLAVGMKIHLPTWTFQGQDMREFLDTLYRNQFASWGLPIDVVLAQLGETNMAASRSAWQQYYRQCEIWQDEHIQQVSCVIDECVLREAVARGELPKSILTPRGMASRYVRPARAMPDPLKEAMAVKAWAELRRDLTGLFSEAGVDFRESVLQRSEDDALLEAQGLEQPATEPEAPGEKGDEKPAKDAENDDSEPAKEPETSGKEAE